jgi:hypothetical protein
VSETDSTDDVGREVTGAIGQNRLVLSLLSAGAGLGVGMAIARARSRSHRSRAPEERAKDERPAPPSATGSEIADAKDEPSAPPSATGSEIADAKDAAASKLGNTKDAEADKLLGGAKVAAGRKRPKKTPQPDEGAGTAVGARPDAEAAVAAEEVARLAKRSPHVVAQAPRGTAP